MTNTTYGSVCSGIEAATCAWHPLGWQAEWFAEIEPFPSAVLAHRWPNIPNLGDMTKLARQVLAQSIPAPDVLVGGTPCQAFSVAGMRAGLDDPRGALTIKYVELADAVDHVRPAGGECIVVWENVPGVLSDKGNAFGCFLGALVGESDALLPAGERWTNAGCVYGPRRTAAWRVLDAQYFGLAQRRRRVFLVASARKGFDPTSVLFESEGLRRDHPPRRNEGKDIAPTIAGGARKNGGYSTDDLPLTAATLTANYYKDGGARAGNDCQPVNLIIAGTLQANGKAAGSVTQQDAESGLLVVHGTQDPVLQVNQAHALGRNHGQENVILHSNVRRLTPRECERLQGFADDYTLIPWRGKPQDQCPDGQRYKAIGNSKAVPVVRWIGRRIQRQLEVPHA